MPVMFRTGSLATGIAAPNVWTGSAFEYVRENSLLSLGIVTPGAAGGLLALINVGSDVVAEEFAVPFLDPAVAGYNAPIIPDQFYFQDAAAAGDRIVTAVRNPTGGTLTYSAVCIVTPVR